MTKVLLDAVYLFIIPWSCQLLVMIFSVRHVTRADIVSEFSRMPAAEGCGHTFVVLIVETEVSFRHKFKAIKSC